MTDKDVVERFVRIVGCGKVHEHSRQKAHWKNQFEWSAGGRRNALYVMGLFLPYLGERRRAKLVEVIAEMDGIDLRHNGRADWADELDSLREAVSSH
jgi:hypothetical protein